MTMIGAAELTRDIEGFLAFKRALGHPYRRAELMLRSFQRFVAQRSPRQVSLEQALKDWLARSGARKAVSVGLEFGVVRQLCLYRRRTDPRSFVPEHAWAPVKESKFQPYIFSHDEVHRLLDAAGRHRGRNIGAPMLRTLILALYCTGLRLGEAVRLQLHDIDLARYRFLVRESKGKTRIVPFRADLGREMTRWLSHRRQLAQKAGGEDPGALFLRLSGQALSVRAAWAAIRLLLRKEGLKPQQGRTGPRPYELRHAFAVHRLTDWYRRGLDIHARLPWLSAYMGHENLLGTEVYLAATPELMRLASERFEARLRRARRPR